MNRPRYERIELKRCPCNPEITLGYFSVLGYRSNFVQTMYVSTLKITYMQITGDYRVHEYWRLAALQNRLLYSVDLQQVTLGIRGCRFVLTPQSHSSYFKLKTRSKSNVLENCCKS